MKSRKILRDSRLKRRGLHDAKPGIARLHDLTTAVTVRGRHVANAPPLAPRPALSPPRRAARGAPAHRTYGTVSATPYAQEHANLPNTETRLLPLHAAVACADALPTAYCDWHPTPQ